MLVRGDAERSSVEVVNGPAARSDGAGRRWAPGNGLRGLRERVRRLRRPARRRAAPQGGWRVAARLPQGPAAAIPAEAAAGG